MKQITNKEYDEFQHYKSDKLHGHILTPDVLRFIIEANEYLICLLYGKAIVQLEACRSFYKNMYKCVPSRLLITSGIWYYEKIIRKGVFPAVCVSFVLCRRIIVWNIRSGNGLLRHR